MPNLARLFNPGSIALFGGGWAENVIQQLQKAGYTGNIWPVHPKREQIAGVPCVQSLDALPSPPDASFIGVNREATVDIVRQLSAMEAGGVICFASGFLESEAESQGGADLQEALIEAAGHMPVLGPNCYGLINYLDNAPLWPDQHGGVHVERGVAIIAQSSNIAINLTMQNRGLPIGFVATVGNQAQTGLSDIALQLLDDERITAIGFYIEGFGDLRAFEKMAAHARRVGKPLVAIKAGRSEKAATAAKTHTASLAGSAAASSAFMKRLGITEVDKPETFLETLKLFHTFGALENNEIASVSCSGGEASMVSDLAEGSGLDFRPFTTNAADQLKRSLGPIVTIANPLDYHTFIWGDVPKMTDVFASVMSDGFALTIFVLDVPRDDRCDPASYQCAIEAIIAAKKKTGANVAVISLLPENTSEKTAARFAENGIVTLNGLSSALEAIEAATSIGNASFDQGEVILRETNQLQAHLTEAEAKKLLAQFGLNVPKQVTGSSVEEVAANAKSELSFPVALKGQGFLHKSEAGAVTLSLQNGDQLSGAMNGMNAPDGFLVEEMIQGCVAELLIGISCDETGLLLLTVGAGGTYTEILQDTATLVLPSEKSEIRDAVLSLKSATLLTGFRGSQPVNMNALVDTIYLLAEFAISDEMLVDLEINPLMVRQDDCVIADAVIARKTD